MRTENLEGTAAVANKTTWFGAWTAGIFGGLSINEAVAIGGFIVAVLGFLANVWYRHKADRRAQQLFELKARRLSEGDSSIDLDE